LFAAARAGSALETLASEIASVIAANETRERARRAADYATFLRCVGALVCNLALSVLTLCGGPVALALRHDNKAWRFSRYNAHGLKARTFRAVIEAAVEAGFAEMALSATRGQASTIAPSPEFAAEIVRRGVTSAEIGKHKGAELIVYTRKVAERDAWRWQDREAERELVEYSDTPAIVAGRAEMRALVEHIKAASIEFLADGLEPYVDAQRRNLHRSFIVPPAVKSRGGGKQRLPPFHQLEGGRMGGGRMGGGAFWLNLRKDRRRASLRIGGEPIAECDYNALFLRLAMARAGHPLTEGMGDSAQSQHSAATDPYGRIEAAALEHAPWGKGMKLRPAIKVAVSALLFAPHLKRFPQKIAKGFPQGFGLKELRRAVAEVYPALSKFISAEAGAKEVRALGYRLLRIESDAILAAALECYAAGVPVLPIHDALICPCSRAGFVASAMDRAMWERAGVVVPVNTSSEWASD
jgi:hypothetical protein